MPFDYGLRLHNRQRLANARAKPIEANKNQSVDGAEGLFLRSGSPQNVYLLPQHPNFRLERCPRPKQICDHPNNEPDKISHPATASPDSRSTASQIEFAIGTPGASRLTTRQKRNAPCSLGKVLGLGVYPSDTLKVIGSPQRGGFVRVPQLLFGLMIEFLAVRGARRQFRQIRSRLFDCR
jgi:hypothetical protein